MRYLIFVLLSALLIAAPTHSRITLLPSDDTSGGGAGNIPWDETYGNAETAWPTALDCMRITGGSANSYIACALVSDYPNNTNRSFDGTVYIRKLVCSPSMDHAWDGTDAQMNWGVYAITGDTGGAVGFSRELIGGSLNFDADDEARVSKTLTIEQFTSISDGAIQVGLVTDDFGAGATVFDSAFNCTVYGFE